LRTKGARVADAQVRELRYNRGRLTQIKHYLEAFMEQDDSTTGLVLTIAIGIGIMAACGILSFVTIMLATLII
jgi:hypothetical protein